MNLFERIAGRSRGAWPELSLNDWMQQFSYMGNNYPFFQTYGGGGSAREQIGPEFSSFVHGIYRSNGVVASAMFARQRLFSEVRFQFRAFAGGRPGHLYGTTALTPLEKPWQGGTTGDLLTRMIGDSDLAGNSFTARRPSGWLRRMRPDWTTIVLGTYEDATVEDFLGNELDTEIVGYLYHPGGRRDADPIPLLPEDVAHFAPIPDPEANYRGMSWLTPVLNEILADKAATAHKLEFFDHSATPNLAVVLNESTPDKLQAWVDKFKPQHEGRGNAYKTLFLGAGADVKVIGSNLQQMDFKTVQNLGEQRIAAASGIHPIILGLSGGLEGGLLNQGNFAGARRYTADGLLRPLWRNAAGTLANIVQVPDGSELWYDARDVSFLQEDEKDAADIRQVDAVAMRQLIDSGFEPDTVVAAIAANDLTLLKHSGLVSVQLQPPGTPIPGTETKSRNGSDAAMLAHLRADLNQ